MAAQPGQDYERAQIRICRAQRPPPGGRPDRDPPRAADRPSRSRYRLLLHPPGGITQGSTGEIGHLEHRGAAGLRSLIPIVLRQGAKVHAGLPRPMAASPGRC